MNEKNVKITGFDDCGKEFFRTEASAETIRGVLEGWNATLYIDGKETPVAQMTELRLVLAENVQAVKMLKTPAGRNLVTRYEIEAF